MQALDQKLMEVIHICEEMGGPEWLELRDACADYLNSSRLYYTPEREAQKLFQELGAPDHLAGHPYAVWAIVTVQRDWQLLQNLSQGLYPRVAEHFGTTPLRVERAIRHLVEVTWMRGDISALERYFGSIVSSGRGKPTNAEFLARTANILSQRLKAAA